MRKGLYVLLLFLSFGVHTRAQTDALSDMEGLIQSQAAVMTSAFEERRFDLLLDYTYPMIITVAGGRDVLLQALTGMMLSMDSAGVRIDSVRVGTPGKIYATGNEWHAIIPQYVYMTEPGDLRTKTTSYLLAITNNQGGRWYYMDTRQLTPELKAAFFPQFNNDLIIPEAEVVTY